MSFPFPTHRSCLTLTHIVRDHGTQGGPIGRKRHFRKAFTIWRPDDVADRIYFLERGSVTILALDRRGRERLQQIVSVNEPFGELCLCAENSGTRTTFAHAETDVTAVEVGYERFMSYVQTNREALTALVFTFCLRLGDCERRSEVLSSRDAQERLGGLLLLLAGDAGPGSSRRRQRVTLPISHHDLARMAAMSRPHVTVTLGVFRRQRLVDYSRTQPLRVDAAALAAYLALRSTAAAERP